MVTSAWLPNPRSGALVRRLQNRHALHVMRHRNTSQGVWTGGESAGHIGCVHARPSPRPTTPSSATRERAAPGFRTGRLRVSRARLSAATWCSTKETGPAEESERISPARDHLDDRGADRVVHRVGDGVLRGGDHVGLHRPVLTRRLAGDEDGVLLLGLPVRRLEDRHARRVGNEVGGAGSRQRLHESHRARRVGRHGRRHGKHVPHWAWQAADGRPARRQGSPPLSRSRRTCAPPDLYCGAGGAVCARLARLRHPGGPVHRIRLHAEA